MRVMPWVNMKEVDARIEHRIMVLINANPSKGTTIDAIHYYFRATELQATILKEDIPGWELLGANKRLNRINKIMRSLIFSGRVRMVGPSGDELHVDHRKPWNAHPTNCRLVPLNALDKIVFALEQDDKAATEPTA